MVVFVQAHYAQPKRKATESMKNHLDSVCPGTDRNEVAAKYAKSLSVRIQNKNKR